MMCVDQFFGGQKQCVGIVCVLVQQFNIILVDEFVVSFDFVILEKIFELFCQVCKEDGIIVIVLLYQLEYVQCFVDWIIGFVGVYVVFDGVFDEFNDDNFVVIYVGYCCELIVFSWMSNFVYVQLLFMFEMEMFL